MNKLAIIGASGHGKVILDIALLNGYKDIVFYDDDPTIKTILDYTVISPVSKVLETDRDIIIAIGNSKIRERIYESVKDKHVVTLIHPDAVIGSHVTIGKGTVVMAGTVINSSSTIGNNCIINTGSTIDHDCVLKDYVHVSVGAHLCGTVYVDKHTWIGAGAIINNNLSITDHTMIGSGGVVVKDIKEKGTYVGVPVRRIRS